METGREYSTHLRQCVSQAAHPAAFRLPHGARSVYATLCALIAPGETRRLSQAQIAAVGLMSEATVSRAMPVLEEFGLISRTPAAGGHDITLIALPEPPSADELLASALGSVADPGSFNAGSATDPALECDLQQGSVADPTPCMDHDYLYSMQEEEHTRGAFLQPSDPRIDELLALGCYSPAKALAVLAAQPPGFTAADAARDLALGERRHKGPGYVWTVLTNGRRLSEEDTCHERRHHTQNRAERPAPHQPHANRTFQRGRTTPRSHLPDNFGMEFLNE